MDDQFWNREMLPLAEDGYADQKECLWERLLLSLMLTPEQMEGLAPRVWQYGDGSRWDDIY